MCTGITKSRPRSLGIACQVWADVPAPGESRIHLMQRLIRTAGLGRIQIDDERNSVFWWTQAGEIYDAGFEIKKDLEPDELDEHYSVDLGHEPTREVVEKFASVFQGPERTGRSSMTVRTGIEINPNLRIDRDCTIAHLDDDVYGEPPTILQTVEVFESSSGLQGRGWVSEIDEDERTVAFDRRLGEP